VIVGQLELAILDGAGRGKRGPLEIANPLLPQIGSQDRLEGWKILGLEDADIGELEAVAGGHGQPGIGPANVANQEFKLVLRGNPFGAGSGASLSSSSIPEPTSCVLLTIGALLVITPRRGRTVSFRGTPRNLASATEAIRNEQVNN